MPSKPARVALLDIADNLRLARDFVRGFDFTQFHADLAKLYRALTGNEDFCDGGFEAVRVQVQPH